MTESEFKELLSRYENGQCSPDERLLLENWLDSANFTIESPFNNERLKLRLKNSLKTAINNKAGIKDLNTKRFFIPSVYKVAASILLITLIGFGGFKYNEYHKNYSVTEQISSTDIQKVLLPDGSIIWLKPNSILKYPRNFRKTGDRVVNLCGEALFEIEKDPLRPFVVNSGDLTTTVLGTSFNIKTTEESIEVVVLTGKVSVTSLSNETGIVLLPEERALYIASSKELAKLTIPADTPVSEDITYGTEYNMRFSDTKMDEIIRRIEGKFEVTIILEDAHLFDSIVTADFTGQSLARTLEIISKVLSIEYRIEKNTITLRLNKN